MTLQEALNGGISCTGESVEKSFCNEDPCPGKRVLIPLGATPTRITLIVAMHGDGVVRVTKIVIALLARITGIQESEIE